MYFYVAIDFYVFLWSNFFFYWQREQKLNLHPLVCQEFNLVYIKAPIPLYFHAIYFKSKMLTQVCVTYIRNNNLIH